MQKRTRKAEWEKRVEEWRASGQDARAYARANGWNERTWTWWIHLLEQEKLDPRDEKGFVEIVPQPKLSAPKRTMTRVADLGRRRHLLDLDIILQIRDLIISISIPIWGW